MKLKPLSSRVLNFAHAILKVSWSIVSFMIRGDSIIYVPRSTAMSCFFVLARAVVMASSTM